MYLWVSLWVELLLIWLMWDVSIIMENNEQLQNNFRNLYTCTYSMYMCQLHVHFFFFMTTVCILKWFGTWWLKLLKKDNNYTCTMYNVHVHVQCIHVCTMYMYMYNVHVHVYQSFWYVLKHEPNWLNNN